MRSITKEEKEQFEALLQELVKLMQDTDNLIIKKIEEFHDRMCDEPDGACQDDFGMTVVNEIQRRLMVERKQEKIKKYRSN